MNTRCHRLVVFAICALPLMLNAQVAHLPSREGDSTAPNIVAVQTSRGHFVVHISDSGAPASGIDSIWVSTAQNMRAVVPSFTRCTHDTLSMTVDIIDSLYGGSLGLHARDCMGNDRKYLFLPDRDPLDTLPPLVEITNPKLYRYLVKISDHRPHDSGLDTLLLLRFSNYGLQILAHGKCDTGIISIPLVVQDIYKDAYFKFRVSDCAGHSSTDSANYKGLPQSVDEPIVPDQPGIAIAPNPFTTSATVNIRLANSSYGGTNIRVVSTLGEDVTSRAIESSSQDERLVSFRLSGATLSPGMYYVFVVHGTERCTRRIALIK